MTCPRCLADPQPEGYGEPRKCAFDESGVFQSDNFSCATLEALWKHIGPSQDFCDSDERVRCFFFDAHPVVDVFGIVALQRYKWRGRTQGAIVFNTSAGGTMPLTLALAEKALEE